MAKQKQSPHSLLGLLATVSAEKDEVFEKKDLVDEVGDEEEDDGDVSYVPGPLIPLMEELEKDKEDESLRRWKEKLLGCVEGDLNDKMEPEVTFQSIGIYSENSLVMTTPLPLKDSWSRILFALKEGSVYRLNLKFMVEHNIVSGLRYTSTVWKSGLKVDQSFGMLGTYAPQRYPYMHILEEETTPSGPLARGIYSAKLKWGMHRGTKQEFRIFGCGRSRGMVASMAIKLAVDIGAKCIVLEGDNVIQAFQDDMLLLEQSWNQRCFLLAFL